MDFVNEQNGLFFLEQHIYDFFYTLFEITAEFCPSKKRSHVEGPNCITF